MSDDKQVNVKVENENNVFGFIFSVGILMFLFMGDPSIHESLRVYLAHLAGLKP